MPKLMSEDEVTFEPGADRIVIIPGEVWNEIEKMAESLNLKPQEAFTLMLHHGLNNRGRLVKWMDEQKG